MFTKYLVGLLTPPGLIILLLLITLLFFRRKRGLRALLLLVILGGFYVMATPWGAGLIVNNLQDRHAAFSVKDLAAIPSAGAIVVLGGGINATAPEYGNDEPSMISLERARFAAHLAKAQKVPLLLSGGAPKKAHKSEAQVMEQVIRDDFNVSGEIWLEEDSKNTNENAIYSTNLLEQKSISKVLLVTHAWHMPRAVALFKKRGLEVHPAPTGFVRFPTPDKHAWVQWLPSQDAFIYSSIAVREFMGLVWSIFTT